MLIDFNCERKNFKPSTDTSPNVNSRLNGSNIVKRSSKQTTLDFFQTPTNKKTISTSIINDDENRKYKNKINNKTNISCAIDMIFQVKMKIYRVIIMVKVQHQK
ncbi:hypothetical protein ACTFIY_007695 [Dictyostelium cf. discoideum]